MPHFLKIYTLFNHFVYLFFVAPSVCGDDIEYLLSHPIRAGHGIGSNNRSFYVASDFVPEVIKAGVFEYLVIMDKPKPESTEVMGTGVDTRDDG